MPIVQLWIQSVHLETNSYLIEEKHMNYSKKNKTLVLENIEETREEWKWLKSNFSDCRIAKPLTSWITISTPSPITLTELIDDREFQFSRGWTSPSSSLFDIIWAPLIFNVECHIYKLLHVVKFFKVYLQLMSAI